MIALHAGHPGDPALVIVHAALVRSVGPGLVALGAHPAAHIHVWIGPSAEHAPLMAEVMSRGDKLIVLGVVPPEVAPVLGLETSGPLSEAWKRAADCAPAVTGSESVSVGHIVWSEAPLGTPAPLNSYPFKRFDFTDEWNNLGYGTLRCDGSIWALACAAIPGTAAVLAEARSAGCLPVPFVTLHAPASGGAVLWWNRSVGPVDHPDWALLEAFIADWGHESGRPCTPVLSELPFGVEAAVTMRLDCDEDVASARGLFDLYSSKFRPLSLAVMTGQPEREANVAFMHDVMAAGGAVVPHSATHPPRWGGSFDACLIELTTSREWITERLGTPAPDHVVSPFHHAPAFLAPAMVAAGMRGFVGGIINTDPEALFARAGRVIGTAGLEAGIVTHSQQCMLHGDCMRRDGGDLLTVPKAAFDTARAAGRIFGYLDHPISKRYDYGWGSFDAQIAAHADLMKYVDSVVPDALWLSLSETLDWVHACAQIKIRPEGSGYALDAPLPSALAHTPALRFQGRTWPLKEVVP